YAPAQQGGFNQLGHARISTASPTFITPVLRGMAFMPKATPVRFGCLTRRKFLSAASGSLPAFTPVSWSVVVTTQRVQGFTMSISTSPILIVFHVSSAQGVSFSMTILGRNRFIGSGSAMRALRSAREAVVVIKNGYPSAKLTVSPGWLQSGDVGRGISP